MTRNQYLQAKIITCIDKNYDLKESVENDHTLLFDYPPMFFSPRAELVKFRKPNYDEIAGAH